MIIVTGGAGFIGSNIVKGLNDIGREDIIVVDDLTDGTKFINLAKLSIIDYLDKRDFLFKVNSDYSFGNVQAIIHQGAESATTEWDGKYMMRNNFEYSKQLLHYALRNKIQYLYASSAAVYGSSDTFREDPAFEAPLNVYGYSKLLFDQYVRKLLQNEQANHSQIAGFRYFNVYGPNEAHKGHMASVAYHLNGQVLAGENVKLFAGCDGYGDGEQKRDFIYVDDCVAANLHFLDNPDQSGIYNLGTGNSEPFNAVANAVVDFHGKAQVDYIPMPEHLKGRYQSFTQADITQLRQSGYDKDFHTVAQGVKKYMQWLSEQPK